MGRQNRTPTIVVIWSILLASIFSLLWVRIDPFVMKTKGPDTSIHQANEASILSEIYQERSPDGVSPVRRTNIDRANIRNFKDICDQLCFRFDSIYKFSKCSGNLKNKYLLPDIRICAVGLEILSEIRIRSEIQSEIRSGSDPRFDPDPIRKSEYPEGLNPDPDNKMLDGYLNSLNPNPDPDIRRILQLLERYPTPGYPKTLNPDKNTTFPTIPSKRVQRPNGRDVKSVVAKTRTRVAGSTAVPPLPPSYERLVK
ncbi:hypothetical protein YC2023_014256 [Brassica napus]